MTRGARRPTNATVDPARIHLVQGLHYGLAVLVLGNEMQKVSFFLAHRAHTLNVHSVEKSIFRLSDAHTISLGDFLASDVNGSFSRKKTPK